MITYKVDDKPQSDINAQLRDVSTELARITPALQKLEMIVSKHEESISSPSIEQFRTNLRRMAKDAAYINRRIAENSLVLVQVSEEASKQLSSIEQHYSTILNEKTPSSYRQGSYQAISSPKQENEKVKQEEKAFKL